MERGYITLYRKLSDHKLWLLEPFTKGQAWVDLLFLANHKDNAFVKRGIVVEVKRGQVGWSEKALSLRWKWSRSKVTRFLKYLKNEHQIEHQNEHQKNKITLLITISNYDAYNKGEHQNEHQNEHQTNIKRTSNEHQTNTNKNDKHYKHEEHEKKNLSPELFEQLWKNYPRKLGKKKSLIAFNRTVKTPIDEKNIETALNIFIETMRKEGRSSEYIPHGSTWFGNWQDWTDYKTQEQTKSEATKIPLMKMEN